MGWGAKPFWGLWGWGHLGPHPGSRGAALAPPGTPHTSSCTLSDRRLIGDPDSTTSQAAWPAARTLWDPSCPLTPLSVGTWFGWHALAAGLGGWMTGSKGRVPAFQRPLGDSALESEVSCEPGHLTAPPPTHTCTLPPSWSQGPKPTSGQELRGQSSRAGLGAQEKVRVERCSCLSTQVPAFVLGARSSLPRSEQRALLRGGGGPLVRPLMGNAREAPWLAVVTDTSGDPSLQEERQTGEAS